jgi:DNA polymerase epsilon subunit 1
VCTALPAPQSVANPCPRVRHPDWLAKKVATLNDRCQQTKLHDLLPRLAKKQSTLAAKAATAGSGG